MSINVARIGAQDSGIFYSVSGLNYKDTPVALRESFSLSPERFQSVLDSVLSHPDVCEAVLLSTCNRTEIITAGQTSCVKRVDDHLLGVLEESSGVFTCRFRLSCVSPRSAQGCCSFV